MATYSKIVIAAGTRNRYSIQAMRGGFVMIGWRQNIGAPPSDWRLCHEGEPRKTRAEARKDGQEWANE